MQSDTPAEATSRTRHTGFRRGVGIYLELAKARLGALVVLTAVVGTIVAAGGSVRLDLILWTAVGTALAAFGANIFNQVMERERDLRMERTRSRPLPSSRISPATASVLGLASCVAGILVLAAGTNLLTAGIGLAVIFLYLLVYTPMKTRTPANTLVGAVCGALPPVMGWTAATGRLENGALILFGILFVWQIPHFLALAWMYRDDYARGGFRMLPAVDSQGKFTARTAVVYSLVLLPLSALVFAVGLSGPVFLVGSQVIGLVFVTAAIPFVRVTDRPSARRLFLASILYLPILLGLMVGDLASGRMPDRERHTAPVADIGSISGDAGQTSASAP